MKEETESYSKTLILILDTGVLSLVTHPKRSNKADQCKRKIRNFLTKRIRVTTSEVCDYEIRRELIRSYKKEGLERLNQFRQQFGCIPVTVDTLDKAAELWAWARNSNQSTAHEQSIDMDVILSAQAVNLGLMGKSAIVLTTNTRHIDRYTPALHWEDATLRTCINRCSRPVEVK